MKIFVTVGTTGFDSLLQKLDAIKRDDWNIIAQTADTSLKLNNLQHFSFCESLSEYSQDADLVICHAGAGSVFHFLENRVPILVVPNLERKDPHQLDLAMYLEREGYASVCFDVQNIESSILAAFEFQPKLYYKTQFFKSKEISELIWQQLD